MIKEKTKKRIPTGCGCLIAYLGFAVVFGSIVVLLVTRSMVYERTSFGNEEMEIINQHLGITIKGSTTPVKLRVIRGRDPDYSLWLENIDDPRKFMGDCFEGTYSVFMDISYLKGFGGTDNHYDYDDDLKVDDAYIVYSCELKNDHGYNRYDDYYIAFYKDGESFKAKVYADDK
ncbi:hypothetical protein [Ruminococcus albus]|jgi:hypothetical protein|uniref:hypothetical protein n=1 Tax=Ruminococcus albus TaxID=1264 RepID=UPI0018AD5FAA|nr:hypothetical protein [Ruminococcus albus]MBE6867191.1 hypothetical protein [Ruminococcus albus]